MLVPSKRRLWHGKCLSTCEITFECQARLKKSLWAILAHGINARFWRGFIGNSGKEHRRHFPAHLRGLMTGHSDRETEQSPKGLDSQSDGLNQGCLAMIGKLLDLALLLSVCLSSDESGEIDRCKVLAKEIRERERAVTVTCAPLPKGTCSGL